MSVVVLGASSGLGAAVALVHACRGDTVVAVARREHRLEQLRNEASRRGAAVTGWVPAVADLQEPRSVEELASRLQGTDIDRLYLNAAASPPLLQGSIVDRTDTLEKYHRLLFGSYVALVDLLVEREDLAPCSKVVAISSLAAALPYPGLELYCAGKSALEAWCKAKREEGAPRFVIARPGYIESEFVSTSADLVVDKLPFDKAKEIVVRVDRGQEFIDVGGWPNVLANRVSSLVGPRARWISRTASMSWDQRASAFATAVRRGLSGGGVGVGARTHD